MQETFQFGSISGSVVGLLVFFLICATVGFLIFALLAHPRFRRVEARGLGKASKRTALLVGGGIGIGLFLLVYFTSINGFYSLDLGEDTIRLHYALPSRTYTLRKEEILRIESAYAFKMVWRLRIDTRDGTRYESAQDSKSNVDAARGRLSTRLDLFCCVD